jgi:hypothetical protein
MTSKTPPSPEPAPDAESNIADLLAMPGVEDIEIELPLRLELPRRIDLT